MIKIASLNMRGGREDKMEKIIERSRLENIDILCLQETNLRKDIDTRKMGVKMYNSFLSGHAGNGVSIVIFKKEIQVKSYRKDIWGKYISLGCIFNQLRFRVISCHISPIEKKKREDIKKIENLLIGSENNFIGGDFNIALEPRLDSFNIRAAGGGPMLKKFMIRNNLVDSWRENHKNEMAATRKTPLGGNRLDLILTSAKISLAKGDSRIIIMDRGFSDHDMVTAGLEIGGREPRGNNVWKLNKNLLNIPEVEGEIRNILEKTEVGWGVKKREIRGRLIWWGREIAKRQKEEIREIVRMIKIMTYYGLEQNREEVASLEEKLGKKIEEKIQYKKQEEKYGEWLANNSMKGIFDFKNKNIESNNLTSVFDRNGVETTDRKTALEEVYLAYSNLFKRDGKLIDNTWECENKINAETRTGLERGFETEEIREAIKNLRGNKAPGIDGLTIEFYKKFKNEVAEYLLNFFEDIRRGEVKEGFNTGLITLLYKGKGDKREISSWRPITCLNVDYKILSKVLSNRMRDIMPQLVGLGQTCSLKNRRREDAVWEATLLQKIIKERQWESLWAGIDQERAFDRVDHDFLFKLLQSYGFGNLFVDTIKTMNKEAKSVIKLEGDLSKPFRIERGVRQGCCLSPLLYVLVIELLLSRLRREDKIVGLKFWGESIKVRAYADDVLLIVKDKRSLDVALKLWGDFNRFSGGKINETKSWIKAFNARESKIGYEKWKFVENIEYLGVSLGGRPIWSGKFLAEAKEIVKDWEGAPQSLKARTTITNTVLIPTLIAENKFKHLRKKGLKKIEKVLFKFIWEDRLEMVSRNTLKNSIENGGWGVIDMEEKIKAEQSKDMMRFLKGEGGTPLLRKLVSFYGGLKTRKFEVKGAPLNLNEDKMIGEAVRRGGSEYEWYREPNVEANHPSDKWKEIWRSLARNTNYYERDQNYKIMHTSVLVGRNMTSCLFCKRKVKGNKHTFFSCPFSREIWQGIERYSKTNLDCYEKAILHQDIDLKNKKLQNIMIKTKIEIFNENLRRKLLIGGKNSGTILSKIIEAGN